MKITMKLKRTMNTALAAACLLSGVSAAPVFANEESSPAISEQAQPRAGQAVYLSDLEYDKTLSFSQSSGTINKDRNATGGSIVLNVNGSARKFIKGMSVWASGEIVYDLGENHGYDLLTTTIGVDYSLKDETYYEGGAKFEILVSDNAQDWTSVYHSGRKFPRDEAESVEVSVQNKRYLKLKADQNGSNWWDPWYDNCVFADAKLKTADYSPTTGDVSLWIKPLDEYDREIKATGTTNPEAVKHTLLMRELVKRCGYDELSFYLMNYKDYQTCFEWLTSDTGRLESWVLGGIAEGNMDAKAIEVLTQICKTHKDDFTDTTPLRTQPQDTRGNLYMRMAMAIALTHAAPVASWVGDRKDDCNISDPMKKYEAYKRLYEADRLFDRTFEELKLEEMRWVMNNLLDTESIEWLNEYAGIDPVDTLDNRPSASPRIDPYTYIEYGFGYDYNKPIYFDPDRYDEWDAKYNIAKYNLSYKQGYPKLWTVFEEGAVCGGLSKTGTNLQTVYGVPSSVTGQPGHASYVFLYRKPDGRKFWYMFNGISTWGETGKADRMQLAMPLNWGVGDGGYRASYLFTSQRALNDYDKYVKAEYKTWLADVYRDDFNKYTQILADAIRELSFHVEAWQMLADIQDQLTDAQVYELMQGMAKGLRNDAKPFFDLAMQLKPRLSQDNNYFALFNQLLQNTLEAMKDIQEAGYEYKSEQRDVAVYLLGQANTKVLDFSFDGDKPNTITFGDGFSEGMVWEYRLDGQEADDNGWTRTQGLEHTLTEEEVAQITSANDIKVHIIGVPVTPENIYTIDILDGRKPDDLYFNDLENRPMGMTDKHQYRLQGETEWIDVQGEVPRFAGDQVVEVRTKATGNYLPSKANTYTFTNDNQPEDRKYIPIENLSVEAYSSQQSDQEGAAKSIDGRGDTIWHSSYGGQEKEHYITIRTNVPREISAVEYVPRKNGSNGRAKKLTVYTSLDGKQFEKAAESGQLANNDKTKVIDFDRPVNAQYIKIVFDESYSDAGKFFASAARFDLFENAIPKDPLTAELEYSTQNLTNQDVTVTLKNSNRPIQITNNGGNSTYTFTQNGTFTFEYVDDYGMTGSMTAEVTWIDKDAATYTVEGMPAGPTNQDVRLTLNFNEAVTVPNADTSRFQKVSDTQYTVDFERNETISEVFYDAAGNETPVGIVMDQIDKDAPVAAIKYENIDGKVIATVEANEPIVVINNNGNPSVEFTQNGEFTFQIQDMAGNAVEIKAEVSSFVPAPAPGPADPDPLTTDVEFSTTQLTNQNVTVRLINPNRPITVTNNGGNTTYTFTQNGEFTFEYVDANGVQGEHRVEVDWIDKDAPVYTISGMPAGPTNQDVQLTVDFNEDVYLMGARAQADSNDQPQFKKVTDRQYTIAFTENGTISEVFYDAAGNESEIVLNMDQIDKDAPVAAIKYENVDGKVIATVEANEPIVVINNNGNPSVEFTQNGEFTFQIQDMAGNAVEIKAEVSSFVPAPGPAGPDASQPANPGNPGTAQDPIQFTITGMPEGKVNTDVVLKVEFDRAVELRNRSSGFVKESDTVYSAYFLENGTLSATFYDADGKEVLVELTVDQIDKIAPTATVQYEEKDGKVIVRVTSDEPVTILDNDGKDYLEFDQNGIYTFKIQDEAGNITEVRAVVNSLTSAPVPTPPSGGTGSGSVTNPGENAPGTDLQGPQAPSPALPSEEAGSGSATKPEENTPGTDPQTPQAPSQAGNEGQENKQVAKQTAGAPVLTGAELAKGIFARMICAAGFAVVLVAFRKRKKK